MTVTKEQIKMALMTGKRYDETTGTTHLQGIGRVQAKPAREIKIGDVLVWNYGYTSRVLGIEPSKTGKTLVVKIEQNGRLYERKMKADRLVAYR